MASSSQDAAAKLMIPPPEQSNIYIVRASGIWGSAISFQVFVNGQFIGTIAPGTFHMVTLDPGEHLVSVISNENAESLNVGTSEGNNYFIAVRPRSGAMTARVSIRLLSDTEGKDMVQKANLAQALNH